MKHLITKAAHDRSGRDMSMPRARELTDAQLADESTRFQNVMRSTRTTDWRYSAAERALRVIQRVQQERSPDGQANP